MPITNLEVKWLVKELQELKGCFFEKMQDLDQGFKIKFTSHELIFLPGEAVFLTRYSRDAKTPSNLSMFARKHLRGSRVLDVKQSDFDRVVEIKLDNGYSLILELFAKGNLILVKEGVTVHCLRREAWKDRKIKPGKPYRFPKPNGVNPEAVSIEEFKEFFDQKDIIRSLVKHLNMSGKYLEEACARAGVDKLKEKPTKEDEKKIFREIKKLLGEYNPGIQGEPVITKLKSRKGSFQQKKTFNEALDDYYSSKIKTKPQEDKTLSKLRKRLENQERAVIELEKKIKIAKSKGDLIYTRLYELQELFSKIQDLKKQGKSWEEVSKELDVEINPKTRKLKVELD